MIKKLCYLPLFALLYNPLIAQNIKPDLTFSVYRVSTLSTAAQVLTVQHPATANKTLKFLSGYMYCSVSCTITLERSGTAATSTAATIVNLNPASTNKKATTAQAYRTSNVGTGTVIWTYQLPATGVLTIDLQEFQINSSTADNFTLRSNAVTGDVALGLTWQEF